jgi:hypothetical protein
MVKRIPREAAIWLLALIALAIAPQSVGHFTLCPLGNAGIAICPGCGLGRSIGYLFRGEIAESWHAHPLGIFAVFVLSYRIVLLILNAFKPYGQSN